MLTLRRGLVPSCLTLGVLLTTGPTLADMPAVLLVAVSAPQIIVLQHVIPSDIIKWLHTDVSAFKPTRDVKIEALPAQNALSVTGTSAGIARMREIIKALDVEQRQTQIKFVLGHASDADMEASGIEFDLVPPLDPRSKQGFVRYASGPALIPFLQTLTRRGEATQGPDITTSNNVCATLRLPQQLPAGKTVTSEISVTPRINADNSVTLDLHAAVSEDAGKREVNTLRTVTSGSTFLISLPPAAPSQGENLLWFVTPTIK